MFFRNLLLFVFFVATERHVNCSQLYALFHRHEGRYLPNRVIRRTLANTETDCAMYCLREEECVSVNYKPSGEERAGLCELNNETLSETFTNDLNKEEFNHLQIFQRVRTWIKSVLDRLRWRTSTGREFAYNIVRISGVVLITLSVWWCDFPRTPKTNFSYCISDGSLVLVFLPRKR